LIEPQTLCAAGDPKQAARAIDALRRGWPVAIVGADRGVMQLLPVETGPVEAAIASGNPVQMLIAPSRAHTLKLRGQRAAADPALPVLIQLPSDARLSEILAVADPVADLAQPMKGPFVSADLAHPDCAAAAIELARLAQILPAFLVHKGTIEQSVTPTDIAAYDDAGSLTIRTQARLPVAANETAQIYGFRSLADATDHIALVIGARDTSMPVVRLHSECLTGDVLGSLKCDCGPQLHEALTQISAASWGVLLYLRQEGRGIGLINKLRAYALQDQGFDTVDANQRLGFAIDARDFATAAQMLRLLGIDSVRLLTNNPEKVAGLEAAGVTVTERLPLKIAANRHNAHYLDTKRARTGHQL
jgi:GTP cyclohydrolase II